LSILILVIVAIAATACKPASAASLAITSPTMDKLVYGY